MHGTRLTAFAERADVLLMEDAAAEVVSLAASHGMFVNQFQKWNDYITDAADDPAPEMIEAGIQIARAIEDLAEQIDEDVIEAVQELAETAAPPPLTAVPQDRPPTMVQTELLRSVGNILSGLFTPLVSYARDAASSARDGSLDGTKELAKKGVQVLGWTAMGHVTALAAGYPSLFGWLNSVLPLLKKALGL